MKKNIIKYSLLFIFFLVILLLFGQNNTDNIWNYGVSHALRMGELPYLDYNSITTPLYQFIMSIGLFIYDSYLTFIIEQAILCLFLVYVMEKLIGKNTVFVLSILFFPVFYIIFANYNFLVILLFLYLLYLDKNNKSDSIIGVVLGLLVLSKHTVGGFILIFSLFATKNIKRSFKRLLFSVIPMMIFLIYLLVTNTFMNFLDLGLFGLFDFAENNHHSSLFFLIIMIICFIYTIYSFIKKKDILNYYLLPIFTLLIPIVDAFHSTYFIPMFLVIIFMREPLSSINIPKRIGVFITIAIILCNVYRVDVLEKNVYFSSTGRMKYILCDKERKEYVSTVLEKYKSYDKTCMLSMYSMYFDIESNKKITYFDIPLYGNFGYDGLNKMKKKIDNMHDTYFFILDNDDVQYANELNRYARKHSKYIENVYDMEIYYKE